MGARCGFFVLGLAASSLVALGFGCSLDDGGTITPLAAGFPDGAGIEENGGGDTSSPQLDGGRVRPSEDGGRDAGAHAADAACGETFSAGTLTAFQSTQPKIIDGLDDDWGCEEPFDLTGANAEHEHSNSPDAGYDMSAACKFEWTALAVYVFCDVVDPTPGDGTSANLTLNDAVEVYISGTPPASRSGNYGVFDHQYVVDWRGHTAEYANGTQLAGTPSAFDAAVATHTGGYSIEASISDSALLDGSSLGASMTLGFDFGVDNGVGQEEAIVWAQAAHGTACGTCTAGCCCSGTTNGVGTGDVAYCDPLAFGSVVLHP